MEFVFKEFNGHCYAEMCTVSVGERDDVFSQRCKHDQL